MIWQKKKKRKSGAELLPLPQRFTAMVLRSHCRRALDMVGFLSRRRAAFISSVLYLGILWDSQPHSPRPPLMPCTVEVPRREYPLAVWKRRWGLRLIAMQFAGRCGTCYPVVRLVGGGVVPFDTPGLV
jgi:hypothetical protein